MEPSSQDSNEEDEEDYRWMSNGEWTTPHYGYVHSMEETETVLKAFSEATQSRYIVYQKDKAFGAKEINFHKCRIFFKATEERRNDPLSVWPEFDGIPYVVLGRKIYGCHLGKDKDYGAKRKLRETKESTQSPDSPKIALRSSKKQGCPAKISMAQVVKFPQYKVRSSKKQGCPAKISMAQVVKFPQYKVKTDNESHRRATFKRLHTDLSENPTSLQLEVRFYIKFNKPEDHLHLTNTKSSTANTTSGETGQTEIAKSSHGSMDYRLVRYLCKLHHQGITRLSEVETALRKYVNKDLIPDGVVHSKHVCPELYPDRVIIQYHLNQAKCTEQLIHIDTTIFNRVVDEWRELYPTHSFYYQAYVKEDAADTAQQVKEHQYARDMTEPKTHQSFVFCYQSDTQQRLLTRFGQSLTVIDFCKKVPVPTYFLMVRTNTCYQVVGLISVQAHAFYLKLALKFLRECNPDWHPDSLMVHNIQEDIDAVQDVFPDSKIHIFDNCREKSLRNWLTKEKQRNQDEDIDTEEVFQLLQETAISRTVEESNQAWEKVKQTKLCKTSARFRYYLKHTWADTMQRWCHHYRSDSLMVTLAANDGMNQLTSALNHDWLDELKTRSLTEIFSGIVSEYLPAHYYRHMTQNLVLPALANQNNSNKSLPKYIKETPPLIQSHLIELIQNMPSTAEVLQEAKGVFAITFPDSPKYKLTFGNEFHLPSCECPLWHRTRMPCSHFSIIFGTFPNLGWNSLSVRYINNPIFAVDEESLPAEIQTLLRGASLQQRLNMTEIELRTVESEPPEVELLEERQGTVESEQRMEIQDDNTDITDVAINLPSPVESEGDGDVEETDAAVTQIVEESVRAGDKEAVAETGQTERAVETEAVTDTEQFDTNLEEMSQRCKIQLERLTRSLGHVRDVNVLLDLEQQLAKLAENIEQCHPVLKRRRMDPE